MHVDILTTYIDLYCVRIAVRLYCKRRHIDMYIYIDIHTHAGALIHVYKIRNIDYTREYRLQQKMIFTIVGYVYARVCVRALMYACVSRPGCHSVYACRYVCVCVRLLERRAGYLCMRVGVFNVCLFMLVSHMYVVKWRAHTHTHKHTHTHVYI